METIPAKRIERSEIRTTRFDPSSINGEDQSEKKEILEIISGRTRQGECA